MLTEIKFMYVARVFLGCYLNLVVSEILNVKTCENNIVLGK